MRTSLTVLCLLLAGCPQPEPEPEPPSCLDLLPGDAFELGAEGEAQFHPRSAFDGATIWTAYSAEHPDGGADFAVFVVGRGCDGARSVGPVLLSELPGNATDPDVVASEDRLLVAWQVDDGGAPWNLSIHTAALDLEGTVVAAEAPLSMEREGAPYEGNAWMPRVAAVPGGFALSGSRGVGNAFQAFVQRLDGDGAPTEPSIDLDLDSTVAQLESTIAADPDGTLRVAWSTDLVEGDVRGALLEAGSDAPDPVDFGRTGGGLRLSPSPDGVLLAGHGTGAQGLDIFVLPWDVGDALELVIPDLQHTPGLAGSGTSTLVLWHDGPQAAADLMGGFVDGDALDGEPFELPFTEPVAGYPADAIAIDDDVFFVSWSQRDSSDLVLYGAFVRR